MPIEDADKVHARGSKDANKINLFGIVKLSMMQIMALGGGGVALIFIAIAAYMFMTPAPIVIQNTTPAIFINDTNISFDIITTNYNYRIIKMTFVGNKTINDIKSELLLSMYPPSSQHYIPRQAILNNNVTEFDSTNNTIYVYTGLDNAFHMSYNAPSYSECTDFINGNWTLNIDEPKKNLYKYKFTITNSKTIIIENGMSIIDSLNGVQDYSTLFVYDGLYKERIILSKPLRLIGMDNPVIDAGGLDSGITLKSSNNVISGFTIINSGNKELTDGGIVINPGSSGNTITKNTIYKTIYGIWLYYSDSNIITNNTIRDNDMIGISLSTSNANTIENNTIYNNINGIFLDTKSDKNVIRENDVFYNKNYGILIENYQEKSNICEYNIYSNNKMSCSNSIDRDHPNITITQTPTPKPTPTVTDYNDWWSDCKGNPKCYQS
jgi:parallel beta-helix repeat protein